MSSPAFAPNPATGPKTEAGKAISSKNAFKHGLSSGFQFIEGEDPDDFEALYHGLISDYAPTCTTKSLLVEDMAKHHWLADRAIRLQPGALQVNNLALLTVLTRYENAKHRAFHKTLSSLLYLKKQTAAPQLRFVSSEAKPPESSSENDFRHDFDQLLNGSFTQNAQGEFAQKYGLAKRQKPSRTDLR